MSISNISSMQIWMPFAGIRYLPARILAGLVTLALTCLYLLSTALLLAVFFRLLLAEDVANRSDEIRNIGLVLAAFLSAPLVLWRSQIAHEQAGTAQARMLTDRFSRAVDQLGAVRRVMKTRPGETEGSEIRWEEEQPNPEVRLGGIYTLQRISEDSIVDHIRVVNTLCAYVRLNAGIAADAGGTEQGTSPAVDIQAIVSFLGKRSREICAYELNNLFVMNLKNVDLNQSRLSYLRFPFADLDHVNFSRSKLRGTDLRQCSLWWADFRFADLYQSRLDRASLRGADLRNAVVSEETLSGAFGVRSGYGQTLLPEGMEAPGTWYDAPQADADSEKLVDEYYRHYRKFIERDKRTWIPESGKRITPRDLEAA